MEKVQEEKGATWELKAKLSGRQFANYDFTKTNFNSAIVENTTFSNCLFDKTILAGSKIFYESKFQDCEFRNVDLSNSTFGSSKGIYINCHFYKCNFRGKEFNFTRFVDCIFTQCKLKKINFNGSSFSRCTFIGTLEDVTFNGMYDTNKGVLPTLEEVNFQQATLGDFVTFVACDLSTCTPPANTSFDALLYALYQNDATIRSTGSKDRIVIMR